MTLERATRVSLPEPVRRILDDFREPLHLDLHLWTAEDGRPGVHVHPEGPPSAVPGEPLSDVLVPVTPKDGPDFLLEVRGSAREGARPLAEALARTLARAYDSAQEIRFFTFELSDRYEEINLLYSISETLGSVLRLDEAARAILGEVVDVLQARRGSIWVYEPGKRVLRPVATVGDPGGETPVAVDDPTAVTARVFRDGRPFLPSRDGGGERQEPLAPGGEAGRDSVLSVPIRYSPPAGEPRTVGVINLVGRRRGDRFTASDQKLLAAIASQVGAALENNRLIQESLAQERVGREMELAHDLQMKLLPAVDKFDGGDVGARVEPAESVGGDFYHLFRLPAGRFGVMIGDVSSHGFPAALIMALSMSAASIYASEFASPAKVLRHVDDALRDELETTEMYLTLFYGVIDPGEGRLLYSNAGHPHAFVIHPDGSSRRLKATDPPIGIAGPDSYQQESLSWTAGQDLLLLFTDGLSDTLAAEDRSSGERRVLEEAARLTNRPAREIVEALFGLTTSATPTIQGDDRTAIAFRV